MACTELAVARSWVPDHHRWRHFLSQCHTYGAHHADGTLLSTAVGTRLKCPGARGDTVAIGMMLVHPHHERQGLGTRMLRHVMDAQPAARFVLQATRFGFPVYQRLGFVEQGTTTVLRAPLDALLAHPAPPAHLQPTTGPIAADSLLACGAPDRWAHLHSTPFLCHPALTNPDHSTAVGLWRNDATLHVGPITAPSADQARDALLAALHRHAPHPDIVDVRVEVPPGQEDFLAELGHLGFTERFTVTEMTLGDSPPRNPRQRALLSVAIA